MLPLEVERLIAGPPEPIVPLMWRLEFSLPLTINSKSVETVEFRVVALSRALTEVGSRSVIAPFEVSNRMLRLDCNSTNSAEIVPLLVETSRPPRIPSAVTRPFDVRRVPSPFKSRTSIAPLDVAISSVLTRLLTRTEPFDVRMRTGPSM